MKRYSVKDILAAGPCEGYGHERVQQLVGDAGEITARQISTLPIPRCDRMWALINVCMDDSARRMFAVRCASRALKREVDAGRTPDRRLWDAVQAAWSMAYGLQKPGIETSKAFFAARDVVRELQDKHFSVVATWLGADDNDEHRAELAAGEAVERCLQSSPMSSAICAAASAAGNASYAASAMAMSVENQFVYYRAELEEQMKTAVQLAEREQA